MNVVSALGSFASSALGLSGGVANFALQAGRFLNGELVVVRFEGKAKLNEPFEYEVTLESAISPDRAVAGMHGLAARLSIQSSAQGPRRIEGIVSDFATIGADDRNGEKLFHYRIRIVSRLWRLSMAKAHRVFEDQSALQVALAVLGDHRIVPTLRVQNRAMYRPIPFLYQRGETDLEFVNRVLALAGITYFFIQPLGSDSDFPSRFAPPTRRTSDDPLQIFESMVLADTSYGMSQIDLPETLDGGRKNGADAPRRSARESVLPTDPDFGSVSDTPGNELSFEADGKMGSSDETVASFEVRYQLAPTSVSVRDWISADDLLLEQTRRSDTSGDRAGFRADTGLGTVEYQRDGSMQATFGKGDAETSVKRALEQVRSGTIRATGKTDSRRIAVGYRFSLTDHPVDSLNTEYIVTSVACQGTNPEKLLDAKTPVYESTFDCMPSSLRPCPTKPDPLPALGPEPATVVGEGPGLPFCDSQGRIRVEFHWAGLGAPNTSGGSGECWVQWLERWAGEGYGTMTLPRVGSEVLVELPRHEGGRPVATGQLYSAGNRRPLSAYDRGEVVGIRSQVIAGRGAYSEISISDAATSPRVYLRAQGRLETHVFGNTVSELQGSKSEHVTGRRLERTEGDASHSYSGNVLVDVLGDQNVTVAGQRMVFVSKNDARTVHGDAAYQIDGKSKVAYGERHRAEFADDLLVNHVGHRAIMIDGSDALHVKGALRHTVEGAYELVLKEGLTISCGDTRLTITKDAININSPTVSLNGKTVLLAASDAATITAHTATVTADDALSFTGKSATLTGTNSATVESSTTTSIVGSSAGLLLNGSFTAQAASISLGGAPPQASSQQQHQAEPPKVTATVITLVDQDHNPCAHLPVLVRSGGAGGTERILVLDSSGSATVEGPGPFDVLVLDHEEATNG